MFNFSKAKAQDYDKIKKILSKLELDNNTINDFTNFWILKINSKIIGVVKIEEYTNSVFISYLGVSLDYQGQGYGKKIIKEIIHRYKKSIFLYTIISKFFENLGFKKTEDKDECLPCKSIYKCQEYCRADLCVTMIYKQ